MVENYRWSIILIYFIFLVYLKSSCVHAKFRVENENGLFSPFMRFCESTIATTWNETNRANSTPKINIGHFYYHSLQVNQHACQKIHSKASLAFTKWIQSVVCFLCNYIAGMHVLHRIRQYWEFYIDLFLLASIYSPQKTY